MEPRNLSQPTNPEPGLRGQGDSASGHLKGEPLQVLSINELAWNYFVVLLPIMMTMRGHVFTSNMRRSY